MMLTMTHARVSWGTNPQVKNDAHTDTQTQIHADRQTDRQTDRHTHTHTHTHLLLKHLQPQHPCLTLLTTR